MDAASADGSFDEPLSVQAPADSGDAEYLPTDRAAESLPAVIDDDDLEDEDTHTLDSVTAKELSASDANRGTLKRSAPDETNPAQLEDPSSRRKRKRATGLLGAGYEDVDATALVPFYTDASQVPAALQKCEHLLASFFSPSLLDSPAFFLRKKTKTK